MIWITYPRKVIWSLFLIIVQKNKSFHVTIVYVSYKKIAWLPFIMELNMCADNGGIWHNGDVWHKELKKFKIGSWYIGPMEGAHKNSK